MRDTRTTVPTARNFTDPELHPAVDAIMLFTPGLWERMVVQRIADFLVQSKAETVVILKKSSAKIVNSLLKLR